ncbi:MAG: LysM peptidoglycan-binding domain-containing protein, partial [Anaerolineales bacterium]|nr:LysM peptidoglycan-binding domain-containing protein [Anaerolineales bacterium]
TLNPPPTITGTIIIGTTTVGRPATYVLQQGEFPYCIARRFNVNPNDLLSQNGLKSGQVVYAGFKLTIPQTGSFPGARALHKHPDSYTVSTTSETIFGIACYYGDVDPMAIAQQNTIPAPYKLRAGQVLQIP